KKPDISDDKLIFKPSNEELNLQIQNITLKKDNQDINIKGNIFLSMQSHKARIQISSLKSPDEIFTWGQFFGGLNQLSFSNLIQFNESVEEFKFDFCEINNHTISSFYNKNIIYFDDDNQTLKMHSQGKANNLNIDLTSQIYQSIDFDQINFDLIYS
ncbi:hypothetical protein ACT2V5_001801, partial [Campylobacter coli]